MQRIVLCRGLTYGGQNRAAVPDFEHDTLFLDVVAGDHDRDYQRHAIHHDLFHILDDEDDGQLYSDNRWLKLNSPGFQYGSGGERMQDDQWSGVLWNRPGFLNKYSTSGVEEDKAEIFAYMMTDYGFVDNRAATDDVIRKKMAAMKTLLEKFCPDIDESFWKGAAVIKTRDAEQDGRAQSTNRSESAGPVHVPANPLRSFPTDAMNGASRASMSDVERTPERSAVAIILNSAPPVVSN